LPTEKEADKLETLRQALQVGEDSGESTLTHAQIIAKAKAELNG
jgi:antitoxin ParD1/3/4